MPIDHEINDLATRQHGVFTRRQASVVGFTRGSIDHRVKRGRWTAITPNLFRITGTPTTPRGLVMACALSGGPDAIASSTTALALRGVRDFALAPPAAVVGRRPPRLALPGVRESFRVLERHWTIVDGIPCATVARALFDAARGSTPHSVAAAVDAALAGRHVRMRELLTVLDDLGSRGRWGVGIMREVLAERDAAYRAPASVLEQRFLDLVIASGIPEPLRQQEIHGRSGRIGTVDFAWPSVRLVVETDGGAFHDSPTDRARDQHRDQRLEHAGWVVLRFGWNDVVHRPTSVIRILTTALDRAAA